MIRSYGKCKVFIIIIIIIILLIIMFCFCTVRINHSFYFAFSKNITLKYFGSNEDLNKLSKFYRLRNVTINSYTFNIGEYRSLQSKYPNISFDINLKDNICNNTLKSGDKSVSFHDCNYDDDFLYNLRYFKSLESIDLGTVPLSIDTIKKIKDVMPKVSIHFVVSYKEKTFSSDEKSINLEEITIDNFEELQDFIGLFDSLESVYFGKSNLSNDALGNLRNIFPNISIDWIITMGKWNLKTSDTAFSVLITNFNYVRLTTEDIEPIKYCTKLKALDLGHQAITDISVIGNNLTELRLLILADNKIEDITPLKNLKNLHYLELFLNQITDLLPIQDLEKIVDLNVAYNHKLKNIDSILNYNYLERLWYNKTSILNEDILKLKAKRPNIVLCNNGIGSTDCGWRNHNRYYALRDMFNKNYISEEFTKYD